MLADGRMWDLIEGDSWRVLCDMPSDSVDACISDPPYCSGGMVRGDRASAPLAKYVSSEHKSRYEGADFSGDTRDQRGFVAWFGLVCAEICRVLVPGGVFALFIDWRNLPAMTDAVQAGGLVWRGVAVWDKGEGVRPQMGRPRSQAEYIVWGSKGPWRDWDGAPVLPGVLRAANVPSARRVHIAQKPQAIMRQLVRMCPPDGVVLDPFAGSGATMVAAMAEGRRTLGVEINPMWAAHARRECSLVADGCASGGNLLPFAGV